MRLFIKLLVLIGILVCLTPLPALAHKVSIFAWVEGDQIHTQSKFSGGKWVQGGTVTVFDGSANQLLTGQTDEKGEFSFKPPKIDDLTIVLNAGMGHANSWKITADELRATGAEPARKKTSPQKVPETHCASASQPQTDGLTEQAIEAIVARQLDAKLKPLTHMLANSQQDGPTIGDIFGGLGYLLGLVGLGAYVRYRREKDSS
jgi:nickel transport protein